MEQSEDYKDGTTKEEPVWSEARFKVLECKVLEKEQLIVTQSVHTIFTKMEKQSWYCNLRRWHSIGRKSSQEYFLKTNNKYKITVEITVNDLTFFR